MKTTNILLTLIILIILMTPVQSVEIQIIEGFDDNPPPFFDEEYVLKQSLYPSRTIVVIDARPDPAEESMDNGGKIVGGGLIAGGICAILGGLFGALPSAGASTFLIIAGIGMIIAGITTIVVTIAGGGQSIVVEAYDGSSGKLEPIPNFIVKIDGGTKGLIGGWGFNDPQTGNTKYLITNDEGKTTKETATGNTLFPSDLHLIINIDDAKHDKRFTMLNVHGKGTSQFILKEASTTITHEFNSLNDLLKNDEKFLEDAKYFNNTALGQRWGMDIHQSKTDYEIIIPKELLNTATIVDYRIVFITYKRNLEYTNEVDEAGKLKTLSDIPYLPRISDTLTCYMNPEPQSFLNLNHLNNKSKIKPASQQDNAYGYVDYLLDKYSNKIHPEPVISASNSMAYTLVWGRYEGTQDDGWITTEFDRYLIDIYDKTSDITYFGKVVMVCLDKNNIKTVNGYKASNQGYVAVMYNYTRYNENERTPITLTASLKELSAPKYHCFWRDNITIAPAKLIADMQGHTGRLIEDRQPIQPFLSEWVEGEKWSLAPSQFKKYIELRTNNEFIPISFCSAYIEQYQKKASITFSLCGNGGIGAGVEGNAIGWSVSSIEVNLTISGNSSLFMKKNFGSLNLIGQKLLSFEFSVSNLSLPISMNMTLSGKFSWDTGMHESHQFNITSFGIVPIQNNFDDYMYLFTDSYYKIDYALRHYPISSGDAKTIKDTINKYCSLKTSLESLIKSIRAEAEQKKNLRALEEIEKAMSYFNGLTDEEKKTMYVGTCESKWKNHYDQRNDMTDPHTVGAYIHISHNLIYLHWLINEQLNKAMLLIKSKNTTELAYNLYAKNIKDVWTKDAESSSGGGEDYTKTIDWTLVIAIISMILAIISSIILYRIGRDKMIIPEEWMSGWRFAFLLLIFGGITAGLFILYMNIGIAVAHGFGGYTSMTGWFG